MTSQTPPKPTDEIEAMIEDIEERAGAKTYMLLRTTSDHPNGAGEPYAVVDVRWLISTLRDARRELADALEDKATYEQQGYRELRSERDKLKEDLQLTNMHLLKVCGENDKLRAELAEARERCDKYSRELQMIDAGYGRETVRQLEIARKALEKIAPANTNIGAKSAIARAALGQLKQIDGGVKT